MQWKCCFPDPLPRTWDDRPGCRQACLGRASSGTRRGSKELRGEAAIIEKVVMGPPHSGRLGVGRPCALRRLLLLPPLLHLVPQ